MKRRSWKNAQPSSIRQAMEWSLEFAKERHNLGVERIAERMGQANHWALYKWLTEGRMPAVLIPAFEHACGIALVSRWLASTSGKLLIDIPAGRTCSAQDMHELQAVLNATIGAVIAFYQGQAEADDTLAALQSGLTSLAWHRSNVQQHANPQLDLSE
jgi:hypothetical protein